MSPILLGVIPFGMIAGVAGVENGMTVLEACAFSLITFAGASQIAALDLLGSGAAVSVAVLTATVINLRFLMFSAAMAPHLQTQSLAGRLLSSYILTDHAYAVANARYVTGPPPRDKARYYLGAAVIFWVTWQLSTLAGALLGQGIPEAIPLAFAVPLSFLALMMPALTNLPAVTAAVVGGAVAVTLVGAPGNLGMLLGALLGTTAGFLHQRYRSWRAEA
ncbi:branched-chain amino acid ABC transporter permease [Ornithinimicrobium avium]|uniref:Branched-chain amino acid ABC transporter permease n=2 Tax=Ornithinimicrobium avium TaxID=2283195 RepID=A0A345NSR5_9MICO|nr:branched-chain amino acid ABC transporter permease [Ornithinimicrobium avium]